MIRKSPDALASIRAHALFLTDRRGRALGARFLRAVREALEQLERRPRIGTPCRFNGLHLTGIRRWAVRGFPNHLIFYRELDQGIELIDIIHAHRDIGRAIGDIDPD